MDAPEKEKFLYGTKWHDYRMLRPDTATLLFIKEWAQALTDFNEACGKSRHFSFLKNIPDFEPETIKGKKPQLWRTMEKLRQQADTDGCDYSDFWAWALQAANDLGFRVTFANVFLSPKLKGKIKEKKREYDRSYTKRSTLPFFRADNYRGLALQGDYQSYLSYSARRLPQVRSMLVASGELHPDFAAQRAGQESNSMKTKDTNTTGIHKKQPLTGEKNMLNAIQKFDFNGNDVRTIKDDKSEPWFVTKDVTRELRVLNTTQAVSNIKESEKAMFNPGNSGRPLTCIRGRRVFTS